MQVVLKKMPEEWKRMLENERKCREVLNKYKKASNECRKSMKSTSALHIGVRFSESLTEI
ncbi:hypothetical protein [Heyndrickxia acidicola]|uniref:Uncharacterized protein n=1 Tax=Heyndrickxia acidicola TaxID=209389 RepID=A0ABU6MIE4_9BACI|nr:hypothetical protein [Heyndrickxia acidicola]MED1203428.1 hypothetical protein [Heyndrickxia acidicola]